MHWREEDHVFVEDAAVLSLARLDLFAPFDAGIVSPLSHSAVDDGSSWSKKRFLPWRVRNGLHSLVRNRRGRRVEFSFTKPYLPLRACRWV